MNDSINFMNYVDGIMIVDDKGTITYSVRFNPRFENDKEGVDFSNIIGKNFLDVYTSIDEEESTIFECLKTGQPIFKEHQLVIDFNNEPMKLDNITIPIINSGKVLGAIELSKDVTKIRDISESTNIPEITKTKKTARHTFDDIITQDPAMLKLVKKAKLISKSNSPVLIYGETGTGKELFVQAIHNESNRWHKPFVAQNFAAIPETLFESLLFGSTKGAFTGSIDKKGLFETGDGGTLFLDELNSMPLHLQSKLLRVLQDGNVKKIGDNKDIHVDVRFITAMNVDPATCVEKGILRDDLYYRINVNSIEIPPLRKRKCDILLLTNYFINYYNAKFGGSVRNVDASVAALFTSYNWHGNVRELQHVIESAMNIVSEGYIKIEHLPIYMNSLKELDLSFNSPISSEKFSYDTTNNLAYNISQIEKEIILQKYEETNKNVSLTAKILGIPRQTLQYKLSKFEIK